MLRVLVLSRCNNFIGTRRCCGRHYRDHAGGGDIRYAAVTAAYIKLVRSKGDSRGDMSDMDDINIHVKQHAAT